jgi:hypothetical protein
MSDLTKKQVFLRTGVTGIARMPLRLTAIVAGLLLTMMPFLLTGCGSGGGGGTGSNPSVTVAPGSSGGGTAAPVGATASLAWSPVQDPSVTAYFVHYGPQPSGQAGSCTYASSEHVAPPSSTGTTVSATVTNLAPNTVYYFAVSAYNGLESACSNEVSAVTPPAPV